VLGIETRDVYQLVAEKGLHLLNSVVLFLAALCFSSFSVIVSHRLTDTAHKTAHSGHIHPQLVLQVFQLILLFVKLIQIISFGFLIKQIDLVLVTFNKVELLVVLMNL
jgi:hypothetical protein